MRITNPNSNNAFTRPLSSMGEGMLHGFTLIELLIVIVIISVVSSVALLTISHNQNKTIENTAHQLAQSIILAEHEAMLRPATLGLGFTQSSYQFYIYKHMKTWEPIKTPNLGLHQLSNTIQITVRVDKKNSELNNKPVIIITESNDITPFTILLGEAGKKPVYQITGEANGSIKSEPFHDEE